jgi:hypothetical protein
MPTLLSPKLHQGLRGHPSSLGCQSVALPRTSLSHLFAEFALARLQTARVWETRDRPDACP